MASQPGAPSSSSSPSARCSTAGGSASDRRVVAYQRTHQHRLELGRRARPPAGASADRAIALPRVVVQRVQARAICADNAGDVAIEPREQRGGVRRRPSSQPPRELGPGVARSPRIEEAPDASSPRTASALRLDRRPPPARSPARRGSRSSARNSRQPRRHVGDRAEPSSAAARSSATSAPASRTDPAPGAATRCRGSA